jgi:uncharacterized protein DUF5658
MPRRRRLAGALVLVALVASAAPARAQAPLQDPATRPSPFSVQPTDVELLLGCQAVLHAADMFTTAYDLQLGNAAREGNPLLAPLNRHPVALTAISGAVDVLQAYAIVKIQHRHPKIARWWASALVGIEVWATINNINAAGQLQRARALR